MSEQKIMDEFSDLLRENTKLKQRIRELEKKNTGLQCKKIMTRLIKADAVRNAMLDNGAFINDSSWRALQEYAEKLEKGEME